MKTGNSVISTLLSSTAVLWLVISLASSALGQAPIPATNSLFGFGSPASDDPGSDRESSGTAFDHPTGRKPEDHSLGNDSPERHEPLKRPRRSELQPFSKKLSSRMPVFIENLGQFDQRVKFQLRMGSTILWLTDTGIVFDALRAKKLQRSAATKNNPPVSPGQGERENSKTAGTLLPEPSYVVRGRGLIPNSEPADYERLIFSEDLIASRGRPMIEGASPQPGSYNYFIGNDPAKWRTHVRGFSEVVYRDVWERVDLKLYFKGRDLEQEFIVRPGGDLSKVQVAYRGIEKLRVEKDGSLLIKTTFGDLRESQPRIYQDKAGKTMPVSGKFKLTSETAYTFEVNSYQLQYALVIDPTLLYSTFLGGSAGFSCAYACAFNESANGIAVDSSGSAYVTGFTGSRDFPTTAGAFQTTVTSASSAFVTKLSPLGDQLVYSTYLTADGPAAGATGNGIAVDAADNAYITGITAQGAFPATPNALQQTCSYGGSYFFTKINAAGDALVYSTCFGTAYTSYGATARAVTLDPLGRAYITGAVQGGIASIPTTAGAYQTSINGGIGINAFLSVFNPSASGAASLVYSTYLGGSQNDQALSVAVDSYGMAYITGFATSTNFPVTAGALQATCPGAVGDGFVAKFNPSATGPASLIYSTCLGGSGDEPTAIAVDSLGNAYVTGDAASADFPITPGAFQTVLKNPGAISVFVLKLSPGGSSLIYSTFLGGSSGGGDFPAGIAVDSSGDACIAGAAQSPDFPTTPGAFQTNRGGPGADAFITKINPSGTALVYSSYLGGSGFDAAHGIALDSAGDAYVTGYTTSPDFPVTPFAFQPRLNPGGNTGPADAFVTKFALGAQEALSIVGIAPTSGGNAGTVSPEILGTGFHNGTSAKLNCPGQSSIIGTNLNMGPGGRLLNTTFDLTLALPGKCDVVIANPDGSSVTLTQAFTVQQGGATKFQLYLTGVEARQAPPEVPLAPATSLIIATISNTGNVDSTGGVVSLALSPPFTLTSSNPAGLANPTQNPTDDFDVWLSAPIAAGASQGFTTTAITTVSSACTADSPPVVACFDTYTGTDYGQFLSCMGHDLSLSSIATCGGAAISCATAPATIVGAGTCFLAALGCGASVGPTIASCLKKSRILGPQLCGAVQLPCVQPSDPNSLVGPPGVGSEHWVAGPQALSYIVSFNNEPTATAPAQQVVVTQPLGPNVDLSTLVLLDITVPNGPYSVQVPVPAASFKPGANINEFITNVDLRPTQNLLVSVDAKLDPSAHTLTWTFNSIDPATGQPPLNPLVGFLPAGSGVNVSFSVAPFQGLATGTQIAEQATIVFQGAQATATQVWSNKVDNSAPVSHVASLPTAQSISAFTVSWSGTDIGSGIQDFTIFVSDNGGPFTPFQTNTTATSAMFTGQIGHIYGFYSIARDLVGNVEGSKTAAEATTQIVTDTTPPVTTAAVSPAPNPARWNNTNPTVTLASTDNEVGGTGVKQITYSASGAQNIASTVVTGSSASFTISTEGITTITFFGTDNAGNVEAAKTLVIQLDKTPPSITGSRTPPPNPAGWNNTSVRVSFSCSDSLSGLAPGSPPADTVVSSDGANQQVSGVCQDLAGNSASATVNGISIDETPPVISGLPAADCTLWPPNHKFVQVATVSGIDALSGLASLTVSGASNEPMDPSDPDIIISGSGLQPRTVQLRAERLGSGTGRTYTLTTTAMDAAGNVVNATSTCTVPHDQGH